MFGMGVGEIMLIGIVALIVIGPKDFPKLFYQFGQFTSKIRDMSRQLSYAMNDAAQQSGVQDIQDTLHAAADPKSYVLKQGERLFEDDMEQDIMPPEHAAKHEQNSADSTPHIQPKSKEAEPKP